MQRVFDGLLPCLCALVDMRLFGASVSVCGCGAEPLYGDVTWGAGGTTSDLTLELCVEAKARNGMEMNMHLTW